MKKHILIKYAFLFIIYSKKNKYKFKNSMCKYACISEKEKLK